MDQHRCGDPLTDEEALNKRFLLFMDPGTRMVERGRARNKNGCSTESEGRKVSSSFPCEETSEMEAPRQGVWMCIRA